MSRTLLVLLIALTSCVRNDTAQHQKSAKLEFNEATAINEIINQTLPILMPDSVELMLLPFYSENPNKKNRELEYNAAKKKFRKFIDSVGMALDLNNTLFVPDSHEVNWMLSKGANKMFNRFLRDSLMEIKIDLSKIDDYGRVKLTSIYPQSSSEMDRHYGFIRYSRILFHSNNRKAFFIYRTGEVRNCMGSETHAVEVQLVANKWKIIHTSHDNDRY